MSKAAVVLARQVTSQFPWVDGASARQADDLALLHNTWQPGLAVTGADGMPPLESAGNVLRPYTEVMLSMRLPPPVDAQLAAAAMQEALTRDPPYGAQVTFIVENALSGWDAPLTASWLSAAMHAASATYFSQPAVAMGEGGSIPFMRMLGAKFTYAQFMVTGVLGPQSNAHGPNEFLHLPTAKKLTCSVAHIIAAHAARE